VPWLRPFYAEARLLAHALRNGLWRSLSAGSRRPGYAQKVLTWPTRLPDHADSSEIVAHLRRAGLRVQEGGHAFYLPPQPGLAATLGSVIERYPPGSGFKVLRDFRGLEEAHYLHPERQTRLRRRLIGTPRGQLIAANYLRRLDLGPRVWDVCLLRAGRLSMPAFVVHHIEGTVPDAEECAAFMQRLRTALAETELRISVPNWERKRDFRCPSCNGNLLRDARGALSYIDFQNFSIRNPQRLLDSTVDGATGQLHFGDGRVYRRNEYLYQSIPGLRRARKRDTVTRFHTIRRLLREQGVDFHNRLVLDIGCNAGVMLHHALATGAWWALGWDRPAVARQARAIADALGFTRLDVTPAELSERYDFGASIPEWLHRHLSDAVVFFLAIRQHTGIPGSLVDLPWRALVYEGHQGESLAEADRHAEIFATPGVRVGHRLDVHDGDSRRWPLITLVREPPAAARHPGPAVPPGRAHRGQRPT